MISNLKHAALNHEKVVIGGGEFSRPDFLLAAHMMENFEPLLKALEAARLQLSPGCYTMESRTKVIEAVDKALADANNYPRSTT